MLRKKLLSLTLALALVMGLTLPALAADTAAVIRLTKTTGTVEISKSSGKSVSLRLDQPGQLQAHEGGRRQ